MSKNDTVAKLAQKAITPDSTKSIKRVKSSIYVSKNVWRDFKSLTKLPRGRTSEILEEFMAEYVRLYK